MPYSFVWLYLIKCVFTCSIFVDSNTKIFLSVLGVFGKYFVFTKTEKFQKQCCLAWRLSCGSYKLHATVASSQVSFGDLFASRRSSREGYIEIFVAQLVTPSRVRLPVAKNTYQIFQNFWLEVFSQVKLATFWRLTSIVKIVRFAKRSFFFNTVLKKGLHFYFLHPVNVHFWSHFQYSTPPWSTPNSSTILSPFSQSSRKGLGFVLYSLFFHCYFLFLMDFVLSWPYLGIWLFGVFIVCFPVVIYWSTLYCDNIGLLMTHEHSLSFFGHSHPVFRVFFMIHILKLTHC